MLFDAKYIDAELDIIGSRIKRPISIYLIGGCAMSFRKLKETTKDVDIVFRNKGDYELFCDALFGAQYHQPYVLKSEHEKLEATKMFENKDGFHLDLFVKKVIGKLELSKEMMARAEPFKSYGNLSVNLLSREDVFLFKGLASEGRKRDLPDMQVLYPNLNWKVIEDELASQALATDLIELFVRRLREFRDTYKLDIPILAKLRKKKDL
ncbi:MAG: hypothetical protein V1861_01380 [Candidatus Micrarchaeota archaeon]